MLYVKDYNEKSKVILLSDENNKNKLYTYNEVTKLVEKEKKLIYGVMIYNHTPDLLHKIKLNSRVCNAGLIKAYLDKWAKVHNPWSGFDLSWYMCELKVGSIIEITVTTSGNYDDPNSYTNSYIWEKKDKDKWVIHDHYFYSDDEILNTEIAHDTFDRGVVGGKITRLVCE